MNPKASSILYFLSDWYKNKKYKSVTLYRDTDDGSVKLVVYNRWGKIVKSKSFRLFGEPKPESQIWWGYTSPFHFEEALASQGEVDAYFKRRKKGGSRKGRRKYDFIPYRSNKQLQDAGAETHKLLFGD